MRKTCIWYLKSALVNHLRPLLHWNFFSGWLYVIIKMSKFYPKPEQDDKVSLFKLVILLVTSFWSTPSSSQTNPMLLPIRCLQTHPPTWPSQLGLTQFIEIFWPPPLSSGVVLLRIYYCRHNIFDPITLRPWRHLWTTLYLCIFTSVIF